MGASESSKPPSCASFVCFQVAPTEAEMCRRQLRAPGSRGTHKENSVVWCFVPVQQSCGECAGSRQRIHPNQQAVLVALLQRFEFKVRKSSGSLDKAIAIYTFARVTEAKFCRADAAVQALFRGQGSVLPAELSWQWQCRYQPKPRRDQHEITQVLAQNIKLCNVENHSTWATIQTCSQLFG